jgi:hypothetical protein
MQKSAPDLLPPPNLASLDVGITHAAANGSKLSTCHQRSFIGYRAGDVTYDVSRFEAIDRRSLCNDDFSTDLLPPPLLRSCPLTPSGGDSDAASDAETHVQLQQYERMARAVRHSYV